MHYFDKFPSREYPLNDKRLVRVTDIISRVVFGSGASENLDMIDEYVLRDGDTPDTLADTLYEDDTLWWIILLFNEIQNPYFDWSLSLRCTERNVKKNYPGSAFFIHTSGSTQALETLEARGVKVNDTIASYNDSAGTSFGGVRGLVYDYDMNLQRILVQSITGGNFTEGNYAKVVGSTSGTFTLGKIVDYAYYGLDHFEGTSGDLLNPLSQYIPGTTISHPIIGAVGQTHDGTVGVSYDNCLLQNYISGDDATYAVTIWENKMMNYDNKRTIKILRPDYVPVVLEAVEKLLNE